MMCFFDITFWRDFVSSVLATLLGALIGIPTALWIDRSISKRREAEKARTRQDIADQRRNQLVQVLLESLRKNYALVEQMEQELRPERVIFYNVDTQLLESSGSIKYEIIDDLDLNHRLDSIRYELLHLHRKVELQLEIEYSSYKMIDNYMQRRATLVGAIREHLPRIKQEIADALSILEVQLPEPAW
jgi:hypothetical protein